jgi:pimeloyl-ACP methyl ester carboxylesterase
MAVLHHGVTGGGRENALLLIHALGADLRMWDDFVAAVGGRVTTIACDLRGAGRSPLPDHPPTLAEHVADLEDLRASLGVEQVVPVGCAVAAMVAASYAAAHPERVPALVLANPTSRSSPIAKGMLSDRAALVRREGIAAILPGAVERAFMEMPTDERYRLYLQRFADQDAEGYALSALAAADYDAADALRQLRCPVLLVPGRHDVLLPIENANAIASFVPQARTVVFEDAAHFVPYQQPRHFADLVLDFIGAATKTSETKA